MGGNISPNIVKDGLVFYMDAANPRSYVSGNTTCNDLMSGEVGALENGTGFSTENNGSWGFDGSDDYVSIDGVLTQLSGTTVGAMSCWVKPTDATPSATEVCLSFGDTNAAQRILMFIDTSGRLNSIHTNTSTSWNLQSDSAVFSDNTWTHIAVVQNGVSPVLYVDGIAVAQTFTTDNDRTLWFSDVSGLDNGRIGDYNYNSAGEINHFDGNIATVQIYNRALTSTEITRNYNALKGRFGV